MWQDVGHRIAFWTRKSLSWGQFSREGSELGATHCHPGMEAAVLSEEPAWPMVSAALAETSSFFGAQLALETRS